MSLSLTSWKGCIDLAKRIDDIKRGLEPNLGRRLHVKANGGRRKTIERNGILAGVYPSVFVVELAEEHCTSERLSFSYADVLTENVELTFHDTEDIG